MNNTADVILDGELTNKYFGYSVSKAGDVNGGRITKDARVSIFNR